MRYAATLLALTVGLLAAGCGWSEHPLSDEKTTIMDADLIGTWEFENKTQERERVHIGRKKDRRDELEIVVVQVHEERVVVTHSELRPTRIGDSLYLSIGYEDEEAPAEPGSAKRRLWLPMRYRTARDRLFLEPLDLERTSNAVESGQIAGTVEELDIHTLVGQILDQIARLIGPAKRDPGKKKTKKAKPLRIPVLSASTSALRTWVAGAGARCFEPLADGEGVLRRAGTRMRE